MKTDKLVLINSEIKRYIDNIVAGQKYRISYGQLLGKIEGLAIKLQEECQRCIDDLINEEYEEKR